MAEYSVAPDGDNGGVGSSTDPWETYIYGFANVGQSNTLRIGTGTYSESRSTSSTVIANGTSGNHTIVRDNEDGLVTLRRSGGNAGVLHFTQPGTEHKYLTFQNLTIDMQDASIGGAGVYCGNAPYNSFLYFIGVKIQNGYSGGALGGTAEDQLWSACHFINNGTDNILDHGLYLGQAKNAIVEDCIAYGSSAHGIRHGNTGSTTGLIIRRNTCYQNGLTNAGRGIIVYSAAGAQIENNLCFLNGYAGIELDTCTDCVVVHNSCHENGFVGVGGYGIVLGVFGNPLRPIVKNNICIGNETHSIRINNRTTNATYDWNLTDTAISNAGVGSTNGGNNITGAVDTQAESGGYSGEWADPDNATPASRDYNLVAGAKAIWNASTNNVPSVGVVDDFNETDRVHPDIGALAFGTPDPPDPPVIGHSTNYPVTAWTLEDIPLTLFDNDSNTKDLTLDGSTDGVSIEFGDTTNCTVT